MSDAKARQAPQTPRCDSSNARSNSEHSTSRRSDSCCRTRSQSREVAERACIMPLDVHGSRLVSGVLSNGVYGSRRKLAGVKRLSPLLLLAVLLVSGCGSGRLSDDDYRARISNVNTDLTNASAA